jgi:phosphoribosylformylglycinamidine synthase subunit PurS
MRRKHIPKESARAVIIEHHEGACIRHAEAHRPQGQTIHGALKRMQYTGIEEVRQGKYFQLTLRAMDAAEARTEVERIAREVLTNPVIEEFTYRLEE